MRILSVLFLLSTCVVLAQTSAPLAIPHIVNSGGWKTDVVLVNPAGAPSAGQLQFFNSRGQPALPLRYNLPAKGTRRIDGSKGIPVEAGSLRIIPDAGSVPPHVSAVFGRVENGKTVEQASIPAAPGGRSFRFFGEVIGTVSHTAKAVRTGLAIANLSSRPTTVTVELKPSLSVRFVIPGNAQIAAFIDELPEMSIKLAAPFAATVRVTSSADVSIGALRGEWLTSEEFRTRPVPVER